MKRRPLERWLVILFIACPMGAAACIWDADTIADETRSRPGLADLILGATPAARDPKPLRERIQRLKAEPREFDPAWWNDLAGAHLRLGEAAEAARVLEPLVAKFPKDYGIHANLGTAYHLLGRYKDAERHIARDLELNPQAHFGLEKYHLALLRYLNRDEDYQRTHTYLAPWSRSFIEGTNDAFSFRSLDPHEANRFDEQFLGATNLLEGAMYMAKLNQQQPACWVMLGMLCQDRQLGSHLNLARAAYQRAIALGSPQRELLVQRIAAINAHIREAKVHRRGGVTLVPLVPVGLAAVVLLAVWWQRRRRTQKTTAGL